MADAMDSKSISREGVGVQVPSLVPPPAPVAGAVPSGGDPLAAALLPAVLHRIHNATQLLSALDSLVRSTGDAGWLERRAEDMAEAGATVLELGYVVAVLASARGANLLLERREARGLAMLCDATREACRREGRELAEPVQPLPELAPAVGRGWELPWAVAALLHAVGASERDSAAIEWGIRRSEGEWELFVDGDARALPAQLPERVGALLPEARCEADARGLRLRMPGHWLR